MDKRDQIGLPGDVMADGGGEVDRTTTPALVLTGRGAGTLALFAIVVAVALATGSDGPLPLLGAMAVALLVAPGMAWARGRRALGRPAVQVALRADPPMVPVDGTGVLVVHLSRRGDHPLPPIGLESPTRRWRLTRRLSDADPDRLELSGPGPVRHGAGRRRGRLAPGPLGLVPLTRGGDRSPVTELAVPTGRRGVLHLPSLCAWTHDPLGLFAVPVAVTLPLSVVVHPRAETIASAHGGQHSPPEIGDGHPLSASGGTPGGCGDFADLTPYRAGDRLHLLDWPALARYDVLLVRRFEPDATSAVRLLLDDRAGVHRRRDFDRLLGTLLGLVEAANSAGYGVELTTLSGASLAVEATPSGLARCRALAATIAPRHIAGGPKSAGPRSPVPSTLLTTATGAERLDPRLLNDIRVVVAP